MQGWLRVNNGKGGSRNKYVFSSNKRLQREMNNTVIRIKEGVKRKSTGDNLYEEKKNA